ncbi:MAG: phosphate-starvation-inducible PsiE family protein [Elainellaceae cyanobacterium]
MEPRRSPLTWLRSLFSDENFLAFLKVVESIASKLLSIAMVIVLVVAVADLFIFLTQEIFATPHGFFAVTLFEIFGLFLNILIALEVLENITAYLKRHVVQVELVIVTSLTAIARKIIIFEFSKAGGLELIGLGVAILALSISYWIVRRVAPNPQETE